MKVRIVGAFDFVNLDKGGQPVKSRELYYSLCEYYGSQNVDYVETIGWKKHPLKILFCIFKGIKNIDSIIMLPAHNGLFVFTFILSILKSCFNVSVFYDVIGGWLPQYLKKHKILTKRLKQYDGIWVETSSMFNKLCSMGFDNCCIIPNFKKNKSVDVIYTVDDSEILHTCIFSRVMEKKGVSDAIQAVKEINESCLNDKIILDIYGPIDPSYENVFFESIKNSRCIFYKGTVDTYESVRVLSTYDLLLFPTKFYTEGIPGTIVDALFSGVPSLCSEWENVGDVIVNYETGFIFPFNDYVSFKTILCDLSNNKLLLKSMRPKCVKESYKFCRDRNIKLIVNSLEGKICR